MLILACCLVVTVHARVRLPVVQDDREPGDDDKRDEDELLHDDLLLSRLLAQSSQVRWCGAIDATYGRLSVS